MSLLGKRLGPLTRMFRDPPHFGVQTAPSQTEPPAGDKVSPSSPSPVVVPKWTGPAHKRHCEEWVSLQVTIYASYTLSALRELMRPLKQVCGHCQCSPALRVLVPTVTIANTRLVPVRQSLAWAAEVWLSRRVTLSPVG